MKRASLVGYLGILLASLALAYLTWVQEPKKPGERVPIRSCRKGEVVKLTYEAKDRTVSFRRKRGRQSAESSWWVEILGSSETPAVDGAGVGEGGARGETPPARTEVFKANNERMREKIDAFCPWMALRSLGKPGEEKFAQFGLAEPEEFLVIEQASGTVRFRLGEETFGPKDRYVADEETGEAFLVPGQDLRDLARPQGRFMERSLHTFKMNEVARVRLRSGRREKELLQRPFDEGKEEGWADGRSPEQVQELYGNWMRRVSTLRPTEYVGTPAAETSEGCAAPAGASQELLLTFYGRDKEIGFLAVYKGRGSDEKAEPAYYACSEHSEIVVKVPRTQAEAILKDLEDVLAQ
jgi:hypothetical protein